MSQNRLSWRTLWRIARRDLHWRFKGLRLLVICLFLGTAALSAIGNLTASIENEIQSNGRQMLGGDLEVKVWQRDLTDKEREALSSYGKLSGGLRMQAMASTEASAAPVGLKAVDSAYPLYGSLILSDGRAVSAPAPNEAWAEKGVLDRLNVKVGDKVKVGTASVKIAGVIKAEPDKLSEGFSLGPSLIVARDFPLKAGLALPGALYESKTRLALKDGADALAIQEEIAAKFPSSGLSFRDHGNASPGADRFVGRMGEFLILISLAALIIAGIGIGGGVSSYLQTRRANIATLKILGATSGDIGRIYAMQIGIAATLGIGTGLAAGLGVTPALSAMVEGLLPVSQGFSLEWAPIATAVAYGALICVVFAARPLANASSFPPLTLMRERISPLKQKRTVDRVVIAGALCLFALPILTADQPFLTTSFLSGTLAILGLLALLGQLIKRVAARSPRVSSPILRTAIANLHRPGSSTVGLVTAMGFGLTAFVLIASVQSALMGNINRTVPTRAPDYFVLDVPRAGLPAFAEMVKGYDAAASFKAVPTLRGAVLAFGPEDAQTRVADMEEIPEGAWALRGERGLTYAAQLPEGSTLVEGKWWAKDHAGEPLVSIEDKFADAVGLKIGDTITIGILGVERSARIANVRRIDWQNLSFNNALVFSPNSLEDVPHNYAATIDLSKGKDAGPLLREIVRRFPSTSAIEVGAVLAQARTILDQVSLATFGAASVTILAGLSVLIGAIAAARASRIYDIVILRVLGASTWQITLLQLFEYGLLTALLGLTALMGGSALGWLIITRAFGFDWLPDWTQILAVLGMGLGAVMLFALLASLPLLRAKPAQALRSL